MKHFFIALLLSAASAIAAEQARLASKALPDLPDPIGVAGPFVGVHNDALIVAGGANFPVPAGGDLWEVPKVYHADAWVLMRKKSEGEEFVYEWKTGFKLKMPVAYGMCVSTKNGVVCIGGQTGETVYSDVFRLEWGAESKTLKQTKLPALPSACTGGAAAMIGEVVYVAGGQGGAGLDTATKNFWRLDLGDNKSKWKKSPSEPSSYQNSKLCLF